MYLVIVRNWQKEPAEVAQIIADVLGILVFEARQKITGGFPVTVATFSDQQQAQKIATQLSDKKIATLIIDTVTLRNEQQLFQVSQFKLEPHALLVESIEGEQLHIDYSKIDLLLAATCSDGQIETIKTTTQRKFSMKKTLLTGGIPMTKKVKTTEIVKNADREKILWLYSDKSDVVIFNRGNINYVGLGDARQLTRELNFTHMQQEILRLTPHLYYDERLLKRASLVNLLGSSLDPETHLDVAFAILSQSLRLRKLP